MIYLLNNSKQYQVNLLYLDRKQANFNIPFSSRLNKAYCHTIRWYIGKNKLSKLTNRIVIIFLFVQKIKKIDPEIIHAWNLDMVIIAWLSALTTRKKIKIIYSLQDTTEYMLKRLMIVLQKKIYQKVDYFFVTSQHFESHFLRKFQLISSKQKVVFVPNVPLAAQYNDFVPRQISSGLTIGYFGFLRGQKALDALVQATQKLREDGNNVQIHFAGIGKEVRYVEALARDNDFVRFSGAFQPDDIERLYSQVDLIYAVYDESYDKKIHLAYRLCESINCGLPIIVAQKTHMSEIVEKYGVGLSVAFGDPKELYRKLSKLVTQKNRRFEIAANCKRAAQDFVFEKYHDKVLNVYHQLSEK
jgi:glycosyltransferase involved in cell wall biosynthesis